MAIHKGPGIRGGEASMRCGELGAIMAAGRRVGWSGLVFGASGQAGGTRRRRKKVASTCKEQGKYRWTRVSPGSDSPGLGGGYSFAGTRFQPNIPHCPARTPQSNEGTNVS